MTRVDNETLLSSFNIDEFDLVVHQMHPDKAPGRDELNPVFFQSFWPVLGKDIFHACVCWLENKEFPTSLNDTLIINSKM